MRIPVREIAEQLGCSEMIVYEDLKWWAAHPLNPFTNDEVKVFINREIEVLETVFCQLQQIAAEESLSANARVSALASSLGVRARLHIFMEKMGVIPSEPVRVEVQTGAKYSQEQVDEMMHVLKISLRPPPVVDASELDIDMGD